MKKILALLMVVCLLFSTGCAGKTGAVTKKQGITHLTTETASSYAVKNLAFPLEINIHDMFTDGENLFFLGASGSNSFLYAANDDGSDVRLIASCDNNNEIWLSGTSYEENYYLYNSLEHCLAELDHSGEKKRNIELPDNVSCWDVFANNEGLFAVGNGEIHALSIQEGKASSLYTIRISAKAKAGQRSDGTIFVSWEDNGQNAISKLEPSKKQLGETHYFDASCHIIGAGTEWELYLLNGTTLYGYRFSNGDVQKLLSFSDCGLLSNGLICEIGNGELLYTGSSGDQPSLPFVLTPDDQKDVSVVLTLGTLDVLHPTITEAVLSWNRTHPNSRIEIRDYSSYSTETDSRGAELKLITDVAAGNAPDLYNLSDFGTTMNASLFARRNILENLYQYIDKDSDLSRDDFFAGPLHCMEIDGGLYQITPYFLLLSTIAAKQDVGPSDQWTYEHLESVVDASDKYDYLFDLLYDRDDWLEIMVTASGKKLIDWSAGQCYFNSDYFIHLLELAKERPDKTEMEHNGYVSALISNSRALLFMETYRDFWEAEGLADIYGGENYAFVGLPEVGSVMIPEMSLGISAVSQNKDLCWEFLRTFLLKDSSSVYVYAGFPLRKDDAIQRMHLEVETLKTDADEYDPQTEQAMKTLLDELENTRALYQTDMRLWTIISGELSRYYAGKKTAEETADAVQRLASLYLSEQG